jgi:hypothetical protein
MHTPEIDAYVAALSPLRQARLSLLRQLVHRIAPAVAETIEHRMPHFRSGDNWVAVASQKSWLSVYLGCAARAAPVIASDPKLKGGKSCVNITDRTDLPLAALETAFRDVLPG